VSIIVTTALSGTVG